MRSVPAVLIALATAFPSISFSQSVTLTTEDLARRSDVVVVGKVTNLKSEWNSDRSRIVSTVTVSVEQHIKGDESEGSVTISTPGGEVDGVGEVYTHMPRFKADERVIVFAAKDQHGQLRVVGGETGKLTVTKDERTGQQMVADKEPLAAFASRLKGVVQVQSNKE